MVVNILDEFADQFVAGVIPHPSIQIEDYLGRSAKALCEKVKRPILLMPAGYSHGFIYLSVRLLLLIVCFNFVYTCMSR